MPEYHGAPKAYEPHALHEDHAKGPHDRREINPKMASDIAYGSKEFRVTGDQLHEAIRSTEPTWKKSAPPFTPTKPVRFTTQSRLTTESPSDLPWVEDNESI